METMSEWQDHTHCCGKRAVEPSVCARARVCVADVPCALSFLVSRVLCERKRSRVRDWTPTARLPRPQTFVICGF